jgi:predicted DNA-binding transcriptional regulator AlpA
MPSNNTSSPKHQGPGQSDPGAVYLSIPQLCVRYNVRSRATIYRWMRERGFPQPVRFSQGCARVPLREVEDWETAQSQGRGRR